ELEKSVGAAERHEHEAVVGWRKVIRAVEVLPEVADGLDAVLVRGADGEIPFHLAGELAGRSSGSVADDEEVVGFPPEAFRLETDLSDHAIDKDGRNAAHEELRQPVGADVLFEG